MSYADQPAMSPRKAVSIGLVILLHALIGYAFITGLAYNVIKKAASELKTVDIKEAPPPPDKPPPPPPPQQKSEPPPVVAPPSIVRTTPTIAPPVVTTAVAPPPAPTITPTAPPAPPPPAPPKISQAAQAKGNPRDWITNDDYPASAARDGKAGVSGIAWTINEQGKVENCHTVNSSGTPELDDTACKLITRRAKYTPAKDQGGNPIRQTASINFRWVLPQD